MPNDESGLQVLSKYIGTWDVVAGPEDAPQATGEYTARWVLGERFVQTTGSVVTADGSNDFEIVSLQTYDETAKTYRTWLFMSNGLTNETKSTWDPETRTMTDVTRYGDITQATTRCFAEEGIERWTTVNSDASGTVVSEMRGTNTRR